MIVLVGCECSQRVALAFRGKGHEAYSCDIQPAYGGRLESTYKATSAKCLNV